MCNLGLSAQVWEPIRADYRNVRGINFVPVYPQLTGTPNYYDVCSPTAMWHFYHQHPLNYARIDEQLDWVKATGFNAVRVLLSSPAWLYHDANRTSGNNQFLLNFADFVARCHARAIYVIPVLWSDIAVHSYNLTEPDFVDPVGLVPLPPGCPSCVNNISYWHRDPGDVAMKYTQVLQGLGVPFSLTSAGRYVAECVLAVPPSCADALLMWDAMNEPFPLPAPAFGDRVQWIADTLDVIKSFLKPNGDQYTTTWSFRVTTAVPQSIQLAALANCDVLSLHPYGHTRATIESFVHDATWMNTTSQFGKPLLCTEVGFPGSGMSYRDAIGFCRYDPRPVGVRQGGVPRPDLGAGEMGIGFMPWAFMVGDGPNSHMPFLWGTGLFYHDGTMRELDAVAAFVDLALAQGVSGGGLWATPNNTSTGAIPLPAVKLPGASGYVDPRFDQNVGPELDDFATQDAILTAPLGFWVSPWPGTPTWTWNDYVQHAKLLRHLGGGFLDVAAYSSGVIRAGVPSTPNGNPITASPRPAEHPDFSSTWPSANWPVYPWPALAQTYAQAFAKFAEQSQYVPPVSGAPASAYDLMLLGLEGHPLYSTLPALLGIPSTPGWLTPHAAGPNQDLFVAILVYEFLRPYAAALEPLVHPRQGPY